MLYRLQNEGRILYQAFNGNKAFVRVEFFWSNVCESGLALYLYGRGKRVFILLHDFEKKKKKKREKIHFVYNIHCIE